MQKLYNFVVNTVSADGLAPLGARPSAVVAMTNLCPICIQNQHLKF